VSSKVRNGGPVRGILIMRQVRRFKAFESKRAFRRGVAHRVVLSYEYLLKG
jgi:hypothetical protein